MNIRKILEVVYDLFIVQGEWDNSMNIRKQENEIFWLTRRLHHEKDVSRRKEIEKAIVEKELKKRKKTWKN